MDQFDYSGGYSEDRASALSRLSQGQKEMPIIPRPPRYLRARDVVYRWIEYYAAVMPEKRPSLSRLARESGVSRRSVAQFWHDYHKK